jgi:hypothetical protein
MGLAIVFRRRTVDMKDLVFVGLTLGFFLLSWLYVRACERV